MEKRLKRESVSPKIGSDNIEYKKKKPTAIKIGHQSF